MDFDTDYLVEQFFKGVNFSQVLLEAVANSMDSNATDIEIFITSNGQIRNDVSVKIAVKDNGNGFSAEGFERFRSIKKPKDEKHKGMGRLAFLQYFDNVNISSVCEGKKRDFLFSREFSGECIESDSAETNQTKLSFSSFRGERLHKYSDINPEKIKELLFSEFLPHLIHKRENGEEISIKIEIAVDSNEGDLGISSSSVTLSTSDLPEFEEKVVADPAFDAFEPITIRYFVASGNNSQKLVSAASVDQRTIELSVFSASSLPVDCIAVFLYESNLFKGGTDSTRQKLVLPEGISEAMLCSTLRPEVSKILSDKLPRIAKQNKRTKETFEQNYPQLIGLFDGDTVGLIKEDEALSIAQDKLIRQQRDLVSSSIDDPDVFEKSVDLSARALTSYVLYRDWIVKKLAKSDDSELEKTLHSLIVPQRKIYRENNLINDIYI